MLRFGSIHSLVALRKYGQHRDAQIIRTLDFHGEAGF